MWALFCEFQEKILNNVVFDHLKTCLKMPLVIIQYQTKFQWNMSNGSWDENCLVEQMLRGNKSVFGHLF